MNLRLAEPADAQAIRGVLLAAFPASDEAAIELVAETAGEIAGHILFSPVEAPFAALALGPIAVRPEQQCQGIGSALILRGHELAAAAGWRASFVLGEPAYYGRFGYSAEAARGFATPYAGPYFMVLALDGELPAHSGEIRHARAFAALG